MYSGVSGYVMYMRSVERYIVMVGYYINIFVERNTYSMGNH